MPKERFHSRDELSSRDASEEKEVLTEDFKVRDFIQRGSWRERHGKPPIHRQQNKKCNRSTRKKERGPQRLRKEICGHRHLGI